MKLKLFTIFLFSIIIMAFAKKDNSEKINLDSVDAFLKYTEKLSSGNLLSEQEWHDLFNTQGYKTLLFNDQWRKPILKEMLLIAYSPEYSHKQDTIINFPDYVDNGMFLKLTLKNFIDMKYRRDSLIDFKNEYEFSSIIKDSKALLRNFLINPVDSLLIIPSLSLACFEPAGYSQPNGIIMDFNLFSKQGHSGNVKFLTHEMFHYYRANFADNEFSKINVFTSQIDILQNEEIANLIDKKQLPLKDDNFPEQVKVFNKYANDTPNKLAELDSIVCMFYDGKISEEQFNNKMNGFFNLGGHPNGFYMSCLIRDAGFFDEMISTFYNPVNFLKLYHNAAKKKGEFHFSNKFLEYIDKL